MRVLVTGGAGFIGANLCRALSEADGIDGVAAYDNLSSGFAENLTGTEADLIEADLLDLDALRDAIRGCGAVVHLGARPSVPRSIEDPLASHHANVTGTLNVFEAARLEDVDQVVIASSSSVYGANPIMPKIETMLPDPLSPYAASKLAGEAYARSYAHSFGRPNLVFRFFNVFGRLQAAGHAYAAVVPAFLDAAMNDRPLQLNGDGSTSRDFTHVSTVTAVIVDALQRGVTSPEPVNLAFGTRTTLRELIALIEDLLGTTVEVNELPERAGDVRHSQADSTSLQRLFPDVKPIELRDALEDTIDWFREASS